MKDLLQGRNTRRNMKTRYSGPEEGDMIYVGGKNGDCVVRSVRVNMDQNKHIHYRISAKTPSGETVFSHFPAETLLHTGFSWTSTEIPFDLSLKEHENCFHIVDLESQEQFDVHASSPSMALAKLRMNEQIGDTVAIHRVCSFTLTPSIDRWIATIRNIINMGGRSEGVLRDCFTHPLGRETAIAPLNRISKKSQLVEMQMDLESVMKKHMPEGISWPALTEAIYYDTQTMKPLEMELGN